MNFTGSNVFSNDCNFAIEFPQVDEWMNKNSQSECVKYAVGIAQMKAEMFNPKNTPGARYWLQSVDHSRLILRIGINAVTGYQNETGDIDTPLQSAKDAMHCSERTKTEIINGGIALGRLKKSRSRKDARKWDLYPSGQQLMEFINFQLYFYLWSKELNLPFTGTIDSPQERGLFSQMVLPGKGVSFLANT